MGPSSRSNVLDSVRVEQSGSTQAWSSTRPTSSPIFGATGRDEIPAHADLSRDREQDLRAIGAWSSDESSSKSQEDTDDGEITSYTPHSSDC
jgi:hypothetical protein